MVMGSTVGDVVKDVELGDCELPVIRDGAARLLMVFWDKVKLSVEGEEVVSSEGLLGGQSVIVVLILSSLEVHTGEVREWQEGSGKKGRRDRVESPSSHSFQ